MDNFLIVTSFLTLFLFIYVCHAKNKNRVLWTATALQFIAVVWSFAKLIESFAKHIGIQKTAYIILLCMITISGPTWLLFCCYFVNKIIRRIYLLFLLPAIFILGAIFRSDLYMVIQNNRYVPQGMIFLANMALTCAYGFLGLILLTTYSKYCNEIKKRQIKIIQVAFGIPLVLGIFTTINMVFFKNSIPVHQVSTSGFSITVSFVSFAIFRYRLLNLRSVAATIIVNNLKEPVLIFDVEKNVNYCNESFKRHFGTFLKIDDFVQLILSKSNCSPGLVNAIYDESHIGYQCEIEFLGTIFFINISSIYDNSHLIGKLMSFNDVTAFKAAVKSLEKIKVKNTSIDITEVSKMIEDEYESVTSKFGNIAFNTTEIEIIKLIAQGKSDKEIATLVHKSYGSVRNAISKLLKRTGAENRTELAFYTLINKEHSCNKQK